MAEKKLVRQSVEHRSFSSTYSYSLHNPTMNCSGVTNLAWPLFTLDEFHIKLDGAHGHAQWSWGSHEFGERGDGGKWRIGGKVAAIPVVIIAGPAKNSASSQDVPRVDLQPRADLDAQSNPFTRNGPSASGRTVFFVCENMGYCIWHARALESYPRR
jgi:hypothetical protein